MNGTVLVTGASRGIGRAIALRLARDGYDVVVHYHARRDAAEEVAAEIGAMGRKTRLLQFDVSDAKPPPPRSPRTWKRTASTTASSAMPASRATPPFPP